MSEYLVGGGITPITYNPATITTVVTVNKKTYTKDILEKIKEELETEIPCYDEVVPFHRGIRKGLEFAIKHIDKHLEEVENEVNN